MKPDEINNPAWDYVKDVPHDDLMGGLRRDDFSPASYDLNALKRGARDMRVFRDEVTAMWAWAIPDPGVLNFLYERLRGCAVVEIGAGNGYWASLLAQMNVDVNAYDTAPMGHPGTWFETPDDSNAVVLDGHNYAHAMRQSTLEKMALRGYTPKEHHPVKVGGPEVLDLPENEDRILFLCWPPYGSDMAAEALKRFKGDLVIYIGEGGGGCTADDNFFSLVGHEVWDDEGERPAQIFKEIDFHHMVQWSGIHDDLYVFERIPQ